MSIARRYLQRKALGRLPGPVLDLLGPAVLQGVDRSVSRRWERALTLAAQVEGRHPDAEVDRRVKAISHRFRRELTAVGAATGAVAATPGIGTGAAASALVADVGWLALRATDLVMAIGAAHGHTDATVEERRAWVLAVLAFGDRAAEEFDDLVRAVDIELLPDPARLRDELGKAAGMAGGDALTVDTLRRVNAGLASRVVTRYGTRRGAVTLGKLLPFGLGAIWGGASTWSMIRTVGANAERFFEHYDPWFGTAPAERRLPPSSEG